MPGCAVRWRYVEQMAADPRITSLRRSEREVWRFLSREADDDGLIRKHLSTAYIARRVDYQADTVRKAVYVLEDKGLCRTTPGYGRTRSLYAVPVVLGAKIADPQGPLPPSPVPPAGTTGRGTTAKPAPPARPASSAPAAPSATQSEIPGIPRQAGHNDANTSGSRGDNALLQNRGESEDVPRELWCDTARLLGVPHKNRRCCHTTPRDKKRRDAVEREVARRRAEAAAAAERPPSIYEPDAERDARIARGASAARAVLAAKARSDPKQHTNP